MSILHYMRGQSNLRQKKKSTSGMPNASDTWFCFFYMCFEEMSSSDEVHLEAGNMEFYISPQSKGNGFLFDLEQGTQEMISFLKHD